MQRKRKGKKRKEDEAKKKKTGTQLTENQSPNGAMTAEQTKKDSLGSQ